MKYRLLIAFVLCGNLCGYSNEFWKKDYLMIDSIARTIEPTANLEKLVNKLTRHCNTDVERYRSIFIWITYTIGYDVEALKKPALRETDPEKVVKKRKAVCAGYSALFLRLCELANLECVTIAGWAKNRLSIGRPLTKTDHAWNAIKINNEWYLCDVTWGAGSVTEGTGIFRFDFKDFYFCTPPELFSYDHFPKDKQWLLGEKISEKKFINRVHFYPAAIKLNLKELSPDDGVIKYKKGGIIDIRFIVDEDVSIIRIHPSLRKHSIPVPFSFKEGGIAFQYVMDTYSPYLYIYLNHEALLVYKMIR